MSLPCRILFVTPTIGAGHAWRAVHIGRELLRQASRIELLYLTGGPPVEILRGEGLAVRDTLAVNALHMDDGILQPKPFLKGAAAAEKQHNQEVHHVVDRFDPHLIIFDEMWFPAWTSSLRRWARTVFASDFVVVPPPRCPDFKSQWAYRAYATVARTIIRSADRALLLNDPDALPSAGVREWAVKHMEIVGPITRCDHPIPRSQAIAQLGWGGCRNIVVTVGGSGAGDYLVRLTLEAHRRLNLSDVRLHVFCGSRLSPAQFQEMAGRSVAFYHYVDNLPLYLAAADLAIVQAGLSSTVEAVRSGVPLIVVPIHNHLEQQMTADYVSGTGRAIQIRRNELTAAVLAERVEQVLNDAGMAANMLSRIAFGHHGGGAARAAEVILDTVQVRAN
ncbi:MAG: glycosyltransferase [Acidobacteriota bacterium]